MISLLFVVFFVARTTCGLPTRSNANGTRSFTVPDLDPDPASREQQITANREGYLYGPSPLGNVSFFLTGPLGGPLVEKEVKDFEDDGNAFGILLDADAKSAALAAEMAGGLQKLSDFENLYNSQWLYTNPTGANPGFFSNYTQDLYFSMERLSLNPFMLNRLNPSQTLPFNVSDDIATKISTQTLSQLHQSGRLFLADYRALADLPVAEGKYTGACSAYFYLHPGTGEFLPLAIKTNVGADLTYTPLDSANDWFFAKTLFESNENFYIASYHLGSAHATAEIVHEAALRTLANQHPVRGLLDRIMYRAYAVRPVGAEALFNAGGDFDRAFAFGFSGFDTYGSQLYHESGGYFQSNYFPRVLVDQGLLNSTFGPDLPNFPFYEDVAPIHAVIQEFMSSFVASYYASDEDLYNDPEIQAWVIEANGPAQVYDFPVGPVTRRETLVEILTQMSYLAGVMHHALNSGALSSSWTLPLHPTAHWSPLPTSKGIDSVVPFLPNLTESVNQIKVETEFNRPNYIYENRTLFSLFTDQDFLTASTEDVRGAAQKFMADMEDLGKSMDDKQFDDEGLCQGMPFIYGNVNPFRIPFFLSI